jgi:phospholipid/cholesterol/gamma-HCH transport system substrate-binding protein
MEENEVNNRLKLGAFVIAGVVLFLAAVFFIGNASNFFSQTFVVSAVFKNVEGLKEGDKVWLSGVQIGTVKTVRIVKVGEVIVSLSLKEKQNEYIRKNATASIGSDGLIGNRIVVIQPGNAATIINDGDTINAVSPADTQELITIAKEVGENTRSITVDLKSISSKLNKGQGIIGELLNEGTFAKDIRRTINNLKATGENTIKASSALSSLVYEAQHGKGLLPVLLTDTGFVNVFEQTLGNVKKVSASATSMSKSIEAITTKMNDNDNAVGVLLADTVFSNELKVVMKNSEKASYKLDENLEALKHNFLTRGYFRRKEKQEKKDKEKLQQAAQRQ